MEAVVTERRIKPPSPPAISAGAGLADHEPCGKNCEYLLTLSPDGKLRSELVDDKNKFTLSYGNPAAKYGKPHITLANSIISDSSENQIINQLKMIGEFGNKIRIILKDYNWFADHTMYINVVYETDTQQLVRKIKKETRRFMIFDKVYPPHFILKPHLTICKNLTPEQYERSKIEYGSKNFSGEFSADKMILLKRPVGVRKYIELGEFKFGGPEKLTTVKQGRLFE